MNLSAGSIIIWETAVVRFLDVSRSLEVLASKAKIDECVGPKLPQHFDRTRLNLFLLHRTLLLLQLPPSPPPPALALLNGSYFHLLLPVCLLDSWGMAEEGGSPKSSLSAVRDLLNAAVGVSVIVDPIERCIQQQNVAAVDGEMSKFVM